MYHSQYNEKAYYYRGKLIDVFNRLEKTIENFLADHLKFGSQAQERYDFLNIIVDRLSFQSKMEAFQTILKERAIQKGHNPKSKDGWPDKQLFKQIQESKDERNRFAHFYLTNPDHDKMESIIALIDPRQRKDLSLYRE